MKGKESMYTRNTFHQVSILCYNAYRSNAKAYCITLCIEIEPKNYCFERFYSTFYSQLLNLKILEKQFSSGLE